MVTGRKINSGSSAKTAGWGLVGTGWYEAVNRHRSRTALVN